VEEANRYMIRPNLTHGIQNNFETKLDVYQRRNETAPQPSVIFIHGGGWVGGSKDNSLFSFLPYLEMGWQVANVEYRLGKISDGARRGRGLPVRAALGGPAREGLQHRREATGRDRRIRARPSSLITGLIPQSAALERQCPGPELPKVAAIVNFYGITDVNDVLDGPNQTTYAVAWFDSMPNKVEIAKRISPLEYVRKGLPAVITVHGDADQTVPYSHATRQRDALTKADVPNKLFTVAGGGHGNFKSEERVKIHAAIREFLMMQHLL
jgi:acetyl esterase/lipase